MPSTFPHVDSHAFRAFCSRFASGVTVATVLDAQGSPQGLTASSFTSVSLNPPLILVCIDHNSGVLHSFRTASHFAVNILRSGQDAISNQFATRSSDRFAGVCWSKGEAGVPLLDDCLAHVECLTHRIVDAGDHAVFFGEVIRTSVAEDGEPLLYFNRNYRSLAPLG